MREKISTKYNNMTATNQHTSAKAKLLAIFASAFLGLTSCEKPTTQITTIPQSQTELSIPDELVKEFQKIEPYSYIADYNKTEKINRNANKIMNATIERIVDTTPFTEIEVQEKLTYYQIERYMKHTSDKAFSTEEREVLLEAFESRLKRIQIANAARREQEAGNEEEALKLSKRYWELRFARPPKSPELRAAEQKMKLLVYVKFNLHLLENP